MRPTEPAGQGNHAGCVKALEKGNRKGNTVVQRTGGNHAGSALFIFMAFTAVAILFSMWLGQLWRNSIFIFAVSAAASYLICRKLNPCFGISKSALLLALLMFALCTHPELLMHPFYPATADAAQTITVRVIGETIPATYEPYAGIRIGYYLGFHSFVRIFADLLPVLPDYLWLWFWGAVFASVELLLVYLLAKELFRSKDAGLYAAILFLGTKAVFQNMYWAAHPMTLGMAFLLFALLLYLRRNPLVYATYPLTFMLHAAAAFNAVVAGAAFLLARKENLRRIAAFIAALAVALPSFLTTYWFLVVNILEGNGPGTATGSGALFHMPAVADIVMFPLWVGIVPLAAMLLALFLAFRNRTFTREKKILLAVFAACTLLYLVFFLASKIMSLISIAAVLLGAAGLSELRLRNGFPAALKVCLLALCLALFFSSGLLAELRSGTKITPEGADFAFAFREYEPERASVFFMVPNSPKIAELSDKVPFNVLADFPDDVFLAYGSFQTLHDAAWDEMQARKLIADDIYAKKCAECIYNLNVEYAVIDRTYFPVQMRSAPVFSYGNIDVYRISG